MVDSRYGSKLGVLGSDFETICEIRKILCLGLVWLKIKKLGETPIFRPNFKIFTFTHMVNAPDEKQTGCYLLGTGLWMLRVDICTVC